MRRGEGRSIACGGGKRGREVRQKYRRKTPPPNVLMRKMRGTAPKKKGRSGKMKSGQKIKKGNKNTKKRGKQSLLATRWLSKRETHCSSPKKGKGRKAFSRKKTALYKENGRGGGVHQDLKAAWAQGREALGGGGKKRNRFARKKKKSWREGGGSHLND